MDEREDSDAEAWLQLKPVEPLPSQCCGSGCSPCVFDLYYRDLERWEAARARNDRSLLSGKQSSETQGCSTKLSPETFLAFHISAIEKLTKDTYHVRFTLPGSSQLGLHPGQHLILRYTQVVGGPSLLPCFATDQLSSLGQLAWPFLSPCLPSSR
ncbi:NADH-cytochrome b5 reductase-like [Microtus ochrogaster]|uniref:NADH-cytochrome b5 reductase-like n=1 Tax=Microtus ochrogaster TaxID=79684 RepID=A0A8J6GSS2_MICOH|nr:NADH-cytochrome b5 reductase-like [Microtus ochrogaster]